MYLRTRLLNIVIVPAFITSSSFHMFTILYGSLLSCMRGTVNVFCTTHKGAVATFWCCLQENVQSPVHKLEVKNHKEQFSMWKKLSLRSPFNSFLLLFNLCPLVLYSPILGNRWDYLPYLYPIRPPLNLLCSGKENSQPMKYLLIAQALQTQ